jgi:hypothetical protein
VNRHWTDRRAADYLYKIGSDYVRQIERRIGDEEGTRSQLAVRLGVSKGRVSQLLNHPGNITLRNIVDYARALGLKIAVVAYDDGDPDNFDGPINSEIFTSCWELMGKPKDFFDLKDVCATADTTHTRVIEAETLVPRKEPTMAYSIGADNHPDRKIHISNA